MSKNINTINGINVFEYEYEKWKAHEQCNSLVDYGVAYKLNRFLKAYGIAYEEVDDTYNNLSGSRDENRYDIMDNYPFTDNLEISFLYVANGNLWAVLENSSKNSWYGEIEISNV
ncbi:MAG: hypothetical protein K6F00_11185 [Lachnospiraceae bacterium]|nr:hypothetical protein [Lachnospiraceae bacterium]